MAAFRVFLAGIIVFIGIYTAIVIANHGMGLLPIFFGDMAAMTWPGQFNADFFCFLLMSGLWLAWRNHFSPQGLLLGVGGVFLGAPYLAVVLLVLSFRCSNVAEMFLGPQRVAALANG